MSTVVQRQRWKTRVRLVFFENKRCGGYGLIGWGANARISEHCVRFENAIIDEAATAVSRLFNSKTIFQYQVLDLVPRLEVEKSKVINRQRFGSDRCSFSFCVAPLGPPTGVRQLPEVRLVQFVRPSRQVRLPRSCFIFPVIRSRRSFVVGMYVRFRQLKNKFLRGVSQNLSCIYIYKFFFFFVISFCLTYGLPPWSARHSVNLSSTDCSEKYWRFHFSPSRFRKTRVSHSTQFRGTFVILKYFPFSLYFCEFSLIRQHRSPRKHTTLSNGIFLGDPLPRNSSDCNNFGKNIFNRCVITDIASRRRIDENQHENY